MRGGKTISVYSEIKARVKTDADTYGMRVDKMVSKILEEFLNRNDRIIIFFNQFKIITGKKTSCSISAEAHESLKNYCNETGLRMDAVVNRSLYYFSNLSDEEKMEIITA